LIGRQCTPLFACSRDIWVCSREIVSLLFRRKFGYAALMTQRIILSLTTETISAGLHGQLVAAGAVNVVAVAGLRQTAVAEVADSDVERFLSDAKKLAGVTNAERDQPRFSM
jgi:hypothetical protein